METILPVDNEAWTNLMLSDSATDTVTDSELISCLSNPQAENSFLFHSTDMKSSKKKKKGHKMHEFFLNMISPYYGIYSRTGFDVISILSKVINRPNPHISVGPVDTSCSFIIVDTKKTDSPIVYASDAFEKLTGYPSTEIIGKNCRFLQSPDGVVEPGQLRRFSDNSVIYQLKSSIDQCMECQYMNINFKKSGAPFVNLMTIIPVLEEDSEDEFEDEPLLGNVATDRHQHITESAKKKRRIAYFVGFQIDIMDQINQILKKATENPSKDLTHPMMNGDPNYESLLSLSTYATSLLNNFFSLSYSQQAYYSTSQIAAASSILHQLEATSTLCSELQSPSITVTPSESIQFDPSQSISGCITPPISISHTALSTKNRRISDRSQDTSLTITPDIPADRPVSRKKASRKESREKTPYSKGEAESCISASDVVGRSSDIIQVLSPRGVVLYSSDSATKQYLGYDSNEMVGMSIHSLVHPGDATQVTREFKTARVNEEFSFSHRLRTKSGRYEWFHVQGHRYEMSNRKKTKCFVVTLRKTYMDPIPNGFCQEIVQSGALIQDKSTASECLIAKISENGLILNVSSESGIEFLVPGSKGKSSESLYATSLYDYITDEKVKTQIHEAMEEGRSCRAILHRWCEAEERIQSLLFSISPALRSSGLFYLLIYETFEPESVSETSSQTSHDELDAPMNSLWDRPDYLDDSRHTGIQYEMNQLKHANKKFEDEIAKILAGETTFSG